MRRLLFNFIFVILFSFVGFSQKSTVIKLKYASNNFKVSSLKNSGFVISNSLSEIKLKPKSFKKDEFMVLENSNLIKIFDEGMPNIPVLSKLIEVPQGATVELIVRSYDEEIIKLSDYGITEKIQPALRSQSKSEDEVPFVLNEKVYNTNDFINKKIAVYKDAGQMRATRLGRIEINPIQYNPVQNIIRVLNNLVVEVKFNNADYAKTDALKRKYYSPYFEKNEAINSISISSKELITQSPTHMVIVADRMFEDQLAPFIAWKVKKGFKVTVGYTDEAEVGTTTTDIKAYLQGIYESSNPMSFVLFVGDVQQIPAWNGNSGSHVTDLRYCEYTGDDIPEVIYGRFSAQTISQLQPQIDKTLMYEKYEMSDPSYLSEVFLVAGDDASYEMVYGNGAIWYADNYYMTGENGINAHTYLQPLDNSAVSATILEDMNAGLAFANYTAHCSSSGWATPSFSTSNVNSLTNDEKYGVWIGNCCLSVKFDDDECFGEAALRKANGGAIGDIGGSNSTYWDEDYWWGVGLGTPVEEPAYENFGLGTYDGVMHTLANEVDDISKWYVTQGQMVLSGNLAVEASSSSRKEYYWEIYHLMGDPSLMNYIGVPEAMTVTPSPSALMIGMTSLSVSSVPYAYVALSQGGTLITAKMSDETGNAVLTFPSDALSVGDVDLVVTAQNKQPYIGSISVSPADEPYVVLESYTTSTDANYGDDIMLNVNLKNVSETGSGYDALNTVATLSSSDIYVSLSDASEEYGTIEAGSSKNIDNAFALTIADNVPDQYQLEFDLIVTGDDNYDNNYNWGSVLNMTVNAPNFKIGTLIINDVAGNGNGMLEPGETADIIIETTNNGHANISNVVGSISYSGADLIVNSSNTSAFNLSVNETKLFVFNVTASSSISENTSITIPYFISGGNNSQYTESKDFDLNIGASNYCASTATSSSDSRIDNVIFGKDMLNAEISNNTTSDGCSTYSDFSNIIANVVQGEKDSLIFTVGTCSGNYTKGAKVFIDWNGDFDFEDVDEEVFISNTSSSVFTDTVEVLIPDNSVIGNVRMRIVCNETSDATSIGSCGTYDWGETEDYTLNISPAITQGGVLSTMYSQICIGDNTGDILLTNNSGVITDWEKKLDAGAWISIGYTESVYSEIPSEVGTWYYRAVIDNGDAYSDLASIIVNGLSIGGNASGETSICEGNYIDLTLSNQNGTVTNWEKQLEGGSWEYIYNTQTNYSDKPAEDGTWLYRAVVINEACPEVYSDTVVVVVNPSAVSGTIDYEQNVCSGSEAYLVVKKYDGNIQWQKSIDGIDWDDIVGANTDSYTSDAITTNTFFRTYVSLGSCQDSISIPAEIKVFYNPVAAFSFVAENQRITFTNSSENATNYLWSFGDGNISKDENPEHTYSSSSTYTVTLKASNNVCIDNEFSKDIDVVVGVEEIEKLGFTIEPNPNDGRFRVNVGNNNEEKMQISIYSINGKLVYQKNNISPIYDIDLSDVTKGIYFVKLTVGNQMFNSKLIIK